MGISDLALVQPKHFPHHEATARASGATDVLDSARVVSSLQDALTDCVYVAGASARSRTIAWPSMAPRECAQRMMKASSAGRVAAVFGPENSGLNNDDLDLCHTLLTIPTDPDFSSLNLAMAVQVLTYELHIAAASDQGTAVNNDDPPATGQEMEHFFAHLEQVLTELKFLDPENPRYLMRRMRRLFIRAQPDKNEVAILRGFLAAIDSGKGRN